MEERGVKSKYIEAKFDLSRPQVVKLSKGKKIRLSYAQLTNGQQSVYITPAQARKIATRVAKGVGAELGPFDMAQVEYNQKLGSGFWSSLKNFFSRGARAVNENVIQPIRRGLAPVFRDASDRVVSRGVDYGRELLDRGLNRVSAPPLAPPPYPYADMPPAYQYEDMPPPYEGVRRQPEQVFYPQAPGGAGRMRGPPGGPPVYGSGKMKKKGLPPGLAKYVAMKKKHGEQHAKTRATKGNGFFSSVLRPIAGAAATEGLKFAAPHIGKAISGQGLTDGSFGWGIKPKKVGRSFRMNSR